MKKDFFISKLFTLKEINFKSKEKLLGKEILQFNSFIKKKHLKLLYQKNFTKKYCVINLFNFNKSNNYSIIDIIIEIKMSKRFHYFIIEKESIKVCKLKKNFN